MTAVEDVRALVLNGLSPLPGVDVDLEAAVGLVCAVDVVAREPIPGFANSSMDGFALRADDTRPSGATLTVTGTILAGATPTPAVGPGEAVRIMTGAPLPEGADAVCRSEDADAREGVVTVPALERGVYVRGRGDDTRVGDTLVTAGDVVRPWHVGTLAAQGLRRVTVHPRPVVGVLSTGDELVEGPSPLPAGKIRDVNRPALLATLAAEGVASRDLGRVGDDPGPIADRLRSAVTECDVVVTTGGVSVGDVDFVKSVLVELAGESARWLQVAVRPGKPFAFALVGSTPVFGLPGNPVSTLVSFELFVRPTLRALAGHRDVTRPRVSALTDCDLPRTPDGKLHVVHVETRVHDDGRLHIERAAREGSHLLSALAGTNALALVPDGVGPTAGGEVDVLVTGPVMSGA